MLGEELCKEPPCLAFSSLILSSSSKFCSAAARCSSSVFLKHQFGQVFSPCEPLIILIWLIWLRFFEANKSRTIQTYCTQISDFSNIAPKVSKYSQPTAATSLIWLFANCHWGPCSSARFWASCSLRVHQCFGQHDGSKMLKFLSEHIESTGWDLPLTWFPCNLMQHILCNISDSDPLPPLPPLAFELPLRREPCSTKAWGRHSAMAASVTNKSNQNNQKKTWKK